MKVFVSLMVKETRSCRIQIWSHNVLLPLLPLMQPLVFETAAHTLPIARLTVTSCFTGTAPNKPCKLCRTDGDGRRRSPKIAQSESKYESKSTGPTNPDHMWGSELGMTYIAIKITLVKQQCMLPTRLLSKASPYPCRLNPCFFRKAYNFKPN